MAQQMTVKERHSADDGIGKVHHQIHVSLNWNVHSIQPLWPWEASSILCIGEKVNLMDVEGMGRVFTRKRGEAHSNMRAHECFARTVDLELPLLRHWQHETCDP